MSNQFEQISKSIKTMLDERDKHQKAIDAINEGFAALNIDPEKARVEVPMAPKAVKKRRGTSGPVFLTNLFAEHGELTTKQVKAAWEAAKRKGSYYQPLHSLCRVGKIKRTPLGKGSLGSTYSPMSE